MLVREEAALVVVDVQERLLPHMKRGEERVGAIVRAIRGCRVLGMPVLVTEQYPKGLGRTVDPIRAEFDPFEPIEKSAFSCCGEERFNERLGASGRRRVILCGIEAHVCVYQTARDLLEKGYAVHLLADGVSSRKKIDRKTAIAAMERMGARIATVEMVLFELLRTAGAAEFRAIRDLVR